MLILLFLPALLTGFALKQAVSLQADTASVERAAATYAAQHLIDRIPKGRVAFDSLRANGQPRSHDQSVALAQILKADGVTTRRSVISCSEGPSSCRMSGYVGIVGVQLESLSDSTAEATVTMRWPSGLERVPISSFDQSLLFAKKHGDWQFVRLLEARSN